MICFDSTIASYDDLWSSLRSIAKAHGAQVPERSSLVAWDRAGLDFEGVALTGKLKLLDQQKGPVFEFHLNPLRLEPTYRLCRKFGSDRFCILSLPGFGPGDLPSYLRSDHTSARETISNWLSGTDHKFLGRTWRAFFPKQDRSKKKGARSGVHDSRNRVYLFAEDGVGFRDEKCLGEPDPRLLDRPRVTIAEMIEWLMPFKANADQPLLKFFARLALGLIRAFLLYDYC